VNAPIPDSNSERASSATTAAGKSSTVGRWRHAFFAVALSSLFLLLCGVGFTCITILPQFSPPGRLASRLQPGISVHDVQTEAAQLGFVWLPDGKQSDVGPNAQPPFSGHIVCHQSGVLRSGSEGGLTHSDVCERHEDRTSFGMYWSSYAAHILIKEDLVTESWFYMD
jgi:hypothetical protein